MRKDLDGGADASFGDGVALRLQLFIGPALYRIFSLGVNDHGALFYLLLGIWTRSAAASFQKIVDTQGNDIRNLMEGMGALHSMYSLLYTLLVIVLLAGIVSLGLTLYKYYAA